MTNKSYKKILIYSLIFFSILIGYGILNTDSEDILKIEESIKETYKDFK